MRIGYPQPPNNLPAVHCADCETLFDPDDEVILCEGDAVCDECFEVRMGDNFTIVEIARRMGYHTKTASQYAEELAWT